MRRISFLVAAMTVSGVVSVFAQGQQYGTLSGRVASADRLPLPGVTVTVSSDALQGERTATTDINGVYALPGLPPGQYLVRFDTRQHVDRRAPRRRAARAAAVVVDQELALAPVKEVVEVRGATPAAGHVARRRRHQDERRSRSCRSAARRSSSTELAPGVTDNTPNASQVTISGAFAYDNLFLMNGVDINDNVLGTAEQPLHRGRDPGSPGADLRHLGRVRPLQRRHRQRDHAERRQRVLGRVPHQLHESGVERRDPVREIGGRRRAASKLSPTYEATAGGPVLRDRLWFFGGVRAERTTDAELVRADADSVHHQRTTTRATKRKLTGTIATGHTLQGTLHRQPAPTCASRRSARPSTRRRSPRRRRRTASSRPPGAACSAPRTFADGAVSRRRTGSCRMPAAPARRSSTRRS